MCLNKFLKKKNYSDNYVVSKYSSCNNNLEKKEFFNFGCILSNSNLIFLNWYQIIK
jgi:hypothetical protein